MSGSLCSFSAEQKAPPTLSPAPPLPPTDRLQTLSLWNRTRIFYPQDLSLSHAFELQAARSPASPAFFYMDKRVRYADLNARANQLARFLSRLGLSPEARVALCLDRSPEMMVALLAILKIGAAYVPLDPAYPRERLAFMLSDSQSSALITSHSFLERLPSHSQTLFLDTLWPALAQESSANLSLPIPPTSLAYVIYTSGSTGQPKGVLGTHDAIFNRFHWMWTTYPFSSSEVCCQKTSLSFVDSVWEIFGPLLSGIPSVILPDASVKDPSLLRDSLSRFSVSRVVLVPSLLQTLLDTLADSPDSLPHLRYCVSSGEALPLLLAQRFLSTLPHCTLLNLYGSSEVAADATCFVVRADPSLDRMLIGRPISNTQVYLLDSDLQSVPIGTTGEIYIGGANLARGYLNSPDLTALKFLPDPFSSKPGARLYKTGDLGRYLPDGSIEYLGRLDHQLKIRGIRIEPAEIEAVLLQYPSVKSAIVQAHAFSDDDIRLIAYLVFHPGQHASSQALRAFVLQKLPIHLLPALFIPLSSFPLTPNGKVDRLALPPPASLPTASQELPTPLSSLHSQLRQIWEDLLSIRPIGLSDNFFYLGGHSLLATRLISQIELAFGKKLSLATLFSHPTIAQLADALEQESRSSRTPLVAIQSAGSRTPFFYLHGAWNHDAFYCFHLARALGDAQPFYALAPYDFSNLRSLPTIEAMATAHLASIRSIQPEGPYLLGGFCNGGLVAYEMARQLQAEGETVEKLVLVDPAYSPLSHSLLHSLISALGKLFHLSPQFQVTSFLRIRHLYKYARHQVTLDSIKSSRSIDARLLRPYPRADLLFLDDNALLDWIIAGYSYPAYSGPIELIWAEQEPFGEPWHSKSAQEPSLHLQRIPGSHIGCRTDHVQSLAEAVQLSLTNDSLSAIK